MGNDIKSEDWENQELEQKDIEYHRTLQPWGSAGSRASNSRDAYWLVGGSIKSNRALTKDHQAFWKHATSWERAWSNLAFPGLKADPLVAGDSDTVVGSHMVIGHVGWYTGKQIWGPRWVKSGMRPHGAWDIEAFVARDNPWPGYYDPVFNVWPRTSWLLVTDIGGRVVGALDSHDEDALDSPWYGPGDLLLVTHLAVSLTGTLVGKIVPTITSKLAKQTMSNEVRNLTSKEINALEARELSPTYGRRWISTFDKGRGPFARPFYAKPPTSGSGPANDVRLAQIYLKSPYVQEHFAILEKELIQRESLGSGLSAPSPPSGPFRVGNTIREPPFNPPRVVVGGGQLSKSAEKFKALPKVSATLEHQKHIELVMKRAEAVDRSRLSWEAQVAYDALKEELDTGSINVDYVKALNKRKGLP